jgi:hypothetical protein
MFVHHHRAIAIDTQIGSVTLPFEGPTDAPAPTSGVATVTQEVLGPALKFSTVPSADPERVRALVGTRRSRRIGARQIGAPTPSVEGPGPPRCPTVRHLPGGAACVRGRSRTRNRWHASCSRGQCALVRAGELP